jgi:hypothetical protein
VNWANLKISFFLPLPLVLTRLPFTLWTLKYNHDEIYRCCWSIPFQLMSVFK